MSAQDKVIKISFAVDPSITAAKRAIEEITLAVKNLAQESANAAKSLNAAGGGGGGGGISSIPPRPGSGAAIQLAHKQAGAGGGLLKGLTAGATGAANVFKSAATASKSAFKTITEGFEDMVDAHEKQVKRLEGIMTRYSTAVGKAAAGGGSGPGRGGGAGNVAAAMAAQNGGAAALQAARAGGGGGAGPAAAAAGAAGGATPAGGAAGGGGGGFFNQALQGIAGKMGIPTGALGGGAAVGAGFQVANFVTGSAYENQLANLNMMVDRPMFGINARADMGRMFGGNALSIRNGDAYRAYSQMQLANDPQSREMLGQDLLLEGRRQMENPTTIGGHMAKSGSATGAIAAGKAASGEIFNGNEAGKARTLEYHNRNLAEADAREKRANSILNDPNASRWAKFSASGDLSGAKALRQEASENITRLGKEGSSMGSLSGTLIQGAKIETTQTDVLALQRAQAEQITLQAKRQQERLEAQMASNPMMQARMNSTFANAISDAGMFRQFGMSGNDIKVGLGGSINAANLMRARAYDQARDVGELAAAAQEMGGTAGRGFLGKYGASLDAKTGGLHNAAQILGVGAQFGGGGYGGGKSFLGGIQGMIGRGGVDVTAGAQVSGLGMGAMTAANFLGTTGSGLMSTLLQAGATGSTGGDMRAAREMGWGMQSRETQAGGGIDALNKAMNLSAAMKASPDAPWTVRNTLSSMSDASIIDILKTGQVPDILANNGVTLDMVQKYHAATNVTKFARFASSDEYGTEAQRGAVGRFREAGGIGYLKGMSSKQRSAELDTLAGALATGTGVSMATARADLGIEAAIAGVGPMVKGRGAHDSFDRKSIAGKAAEAKAILEAAEGEKISVESEQYRKVFGNMPLAVAHNEVARLQGQAGTKDGDVGTAIQSITEALNHFVDAMKTEFSGGGKTGGHGAPKVQ